MLHLENAEELGLPPIPDESIVRRIHALRERGIFVGARDKRMNTAYIGKFMVSEPYPEGHSQLGNGPDQPACIVGDDIVQIMATFEAMLA